MPSDGTPFQPSGSDAVLRSALALLIVAIAGCLVTAHVQGPLSGTACLASGLFTSVAAALVYLRMRRTPAPRTVADVPPRTHPQIVALAEAGPDALLFLQPILNSEDEVRSFRISYANRRSSDLLHDAPHSLTGLEVGSLFPFLAGVGVMQQYRSVLTTGKPCALELAVRNTQLTARWMHVAITKFEEGLLLTLQDKTEARETERKLCLQIQQDALTGLPNRTLLDDRIQQALKRAQRNHGAAAVLLLDLDNFKNVNETYGRVAGDHVLRTVATRLTEAVRSTDSVMRLGGDEFVIVFNDLLAHSPVTDFARKILVSMFAPIAWEDLQLQVTASIGVAMYPAAGTTPETLLVQADIEMNRMKRAHFPPAVNSAPPLPLDSRSFSLSLT